MQYHLFLAQICENEIEKLNQYVIDRENHNSLFFRELGIDDFEFKNNELNYGLSVLQPSFEYNFPLSELLKLTMVKKEDLPQIENFCKEKNISPNSYITLYKEGLKLNPNFHLSYPNLYYIGEFDMDKSYEELERLVYPELFSE